MSSAYQKVVRLGLGRMLEDLGSLAGLGPLQLVYQRLRSNPVEWVTNDRDLVVGG